MRGKRDLTMPFSIGMVVVLAALVLIPLGWLVVTSVHDDATQALTFDNYLHLVSDSAFAMVVVLPFLV